MMMCAAIGTLVATPGGERPIEGIAVGDVVYSVDGDATVAVPVARIARTVVTSGHKIMRVAFAGGAVVEMSPTHPTADGRSFEELAAGDLLGHAEIVGVSPMSYGYAFTYDILPTSSTGIYFAAGVPVGSTLSRAGGCAGESASREAFTAARDPALR